MVRLYELCLLGLHSNAQIDSRLNLVSCERQSPYESCGGGPNMMSLLITEQTRDKSLPIFRLHFDHVVGRKLPISNYDIISKYISSILHKNINNLFHWIIFLFMF